MIKKNDPLFYDVRLLERNIKNGALPPKEVEKHLKSLPDISDKAEKLLQEEPPGKSESKGDSVKKAEGVE